MRKIIKYLLLLFVIFTLIHFGKSDFQKIYSESDKDPVKFVKGVTKESYKILQEDYNFNIRVKDKVKDILDNANDKEDE